MMLGILFGRNISEQKMTRVALQIIYFYFVYLSCKNAAQKYLCPRVKIKVSF